MRSMAWAGKGTKAGDARGSKAGKEAKEGTVRAQMKRGQDVATGMGKKKA